MVLVCSFVRGSWMNEWLTRLTALMRPFLHASTNWSCKDCTDSRNAQIWVCVFVCVYVQVSESMRVDSVTFGFDGCVHAFAGAWMDEQQ